MNDVMIRSFLTLANTRNFTEAAHQLYFTQQALSKQIAKMEQELNCMLFLRERNNITLTHEGNIYFEAMSQMDKLMTKAKTEVVFGPGEINHFVPGENSQFWPDENRQFG